MQDPRKAKSDAAKAYLRHYERTVRRIRASFLPYVEPEVLDGIEHCAKAQPGSRFDQLHATLVDLLDNADFADAENRSAFATAYKEADASVHRASAVFLRHAQSVNEWTRSHSLGQVDLSLLRSIDLASHADSTYGAFVSQMCEKLDEHVEPPSVKGYAQFFEVYCEAMTLRFLRGRKGLRASRVVEVKAKDEKRPDFKCALDDGSEFYVEVKAFDVVGGDLRQDQMMVDAVDQTVALKEQSAAGKRIAWAEGVIEPYRKFGEGRAYDPSSLIRVIETVRAKCDQAFKHEQFAQGPTFALAVLDRLVMPGGQCALAPYYYDDFDGGRCVSGCLWQAAFGTVGTPILRHPRFDGIACLEGHLANPGYLVDAGRAFPGIGLIFLVRDGEKRLAYGLATEHAPFGAWTTEKTEEALQVICDAFNDRSNANASAVSRYGKR